MMDLYKREKVNPAAGCLHGGTQDLDLLVAVERGPLADRAQHYDAVDAVVHQRGDVLLEIDGEPLVSEKGGQRFGSVEPGQQVRWTYRRGGETRTTTATAGQRPDMPPPPPPAPPRRNWVSASSTASPAAASGPSSTSSRLPARTISTPERYSTPPVLRAPTPPRSATRPTTTATAAPTRAATASTARQRPAAPRCQGHHSKPGAPGTRRWHRHHRQGPVEICGQALQGCPGK